MKKILMMVVIWLWLPLSASADVIVLCYHSFLGTSKNEYDIPKDQFKNQIEIIKQLGYPFIGFDDLVKGNIKGKHQVLITIDDGNHSLPLIYDDVLKANGIKPVLGIYPNPIGKRSDFITFDVLKSYIDSGATLAAHGFYHLYINQKLFQKNPSEFKGEIFKSKEVLEKKISVPVTVFIYPFGLVTDIGKEYLKKASFQYAFSLRQNLMKVPLNLNEDLFDLPRYMVTKTSWSHIHNVLKKYAPAGIRSEVSSGKF